MIGKRIRKERLKKCLSQEELSKVVSVTQQAVNKWETEKSIPDPLTISNLADFFGVSTDYLLGRTDDPTPPDADEPTDRELEELMLKGGLMFDGVPLDDDDKQDILDVMRIAWKTIQRRKQK